MDDKRGPAGFRLSLVSTKGDWWMTEESYLDTRVLEFADYIQCDPELAQELYFLEVHLKPR